MSTAAPTEPVTLDPNTGAFVKALEAQGGPPLYTLSPADARAVLSKPLFVSSGVGDRYEAPSGYRGPHDPWGTDR